MEVVELNEKFNEALFSGFRQILEKSFIKINHEINAELVLEKIKNLPVDKEAIISKIKNLKEEEWSIQYLTKSIKEIDDITGISDDFIKKHAVQELKKSDLKEVKWEIMKKMMVDYAKFTKEFYDSLKYSKNSNLEREKYLLMIEMMNALKKIHESSKSLVDKFYQKKYNPRSFKKFIDIRLGLEHLLLRVFNILLNINNKTKIPQFRDVLSREILEYTIRQTK